MWWSDALSLGLWAALILVAHYWVGWVNESHETNLLAPPLFGHFDLRLSWRALLVVAFAVAAVDLAPRLAQRVTWRALLLSSVVVGALWAVALSFVDGADALTEPLRNPNDYLVNVPAVGALHTFLSGYTNDISSYSIHAQGHPPGVILLLTGLERSGIGGAGWATAAFVASAASASAAVLIAVRDVAGHATARACAPFLALAPAAVWIATSADGLFMGVSAWGVSLLIVATGRSDRAADLYAGAGGLLLGLALFLSYGIVPLGGVVLAVALARRRLRPLLIGGVTAGIVVALFGVGGFWWWEGLAATLDRYEMGVAASRPYAPFFVSNLAALALALGPACAIAVARLKDSRAWLLCGGALVAVIASNLSGFSKGEVERIWLPFVPWLLVATCAFAVERRRGLLGMQAAVALALQMGVRSPW